MCKFVPKVIVICTLCVRMRAARLYVRDVKTTAYSLNRNQIQLTSITNQLSLNTMKKLITLLALCCLMVTGAWAQGTYGPFPNVSGWTKETMQNWIPTSIPQGIADIQSHAYAASAYGGTQGLVKFDTSATATATFEYSSGNCGAWIIGVELLNPSTDAVVSSCYSKQFTGGGHQRVSYELAGIVADEVYLMRIYYSPEGDVGNPQKPYRDSANGTITWTGSTPTPYSDENEYNVKYTLTDANGNVYTGNFTGATSDSPFTGVSSMTLSNVSYTDSSTPGYDKDLTATVSFPFTVSNGSDNNYVYISSFGTAHYWYSENTDVKATKAAVPERTDYEKYAWAIIPEFNGTDVTLKIKNVATGKYINSTATTQSHNQGTVTLADEGTAVHYVANAFQFTTTSKYLSLNSNIGATGSTQYVGAWNTTHNGTAITITTVPFGKFPYDVAATRYVTIENKDTSRDPFLYNDIQYADEITLQAASVDATKNGYIWKVTSNGEGNITVLNAENGKGIKPSAADHCSSNITAFQVTAGANAGYYNLINSTAITNGHDRLNAANSTDYYHNEANLRAVTTWTGTHNDNDWKFNILNTEGLTEYTVTVTQPEGCRGYAVYNNKKAADGGFFLASGLQQTDISAGEVSGYTSNVTISGTTIEVEYTASTVDYTVNIMGPTDAAVTFGSNTYTNGQTISATGLTTTDLTATNVPGYHYTLTIGTNNVINVVYTQNVITEAVSYGPLTGDSWSTVSSAADGLLNPEGGSTVALSNLRMIERSYIFSGCGRLESTFMYSSGNHGIDIAGVEVVDEDGTVVSADYHFGFSGTAKTNHVYNVLVPDAGVYYIRYYSIYGSNTNTNGNINNVFTAVTRQDYTVHIVNAPTDAKVTYDGEEYGNGDVIEDAILLARDIEAPTFEDLTLVGVTINGTDIYVTYGDYKVVFDNAHSDVPYRIPAVGQTKDGDLIFVADYRYSKADIGAGTRLDLRYRKKYASDGHWGDVETLVHYIPEPFCAFGDPCIVCDRESNRVMVTSCCGNVSFPNGTYSNHQGWARWYSNDGGETWESSFTDLAPQVVRQLDERQGDQMNAFFIGSGKISQSHIIKKGQYYRLYCASNTRMQSGKCNFVWYSDDFGATWNLLGSPDVKAINGGDEPKADELPDGSVVISSRDSGRIFNIFHYTDYENAEGYWGTQATSSSNNSGCYGTGCNGEILIVPVMKKSDNSKTYLALQSIPAAGSRRDVSIYWKELTDFTKYRNASELAPNWTKFQVSTTTSAYSTMCQLQDGHVAFFYEENEYNGGYDMIYKNFTVEDITNDLYEFYDLNSAAKASEKAAYLTSCVGTYFDEETEEIQELAEAYEAAPTMKNYDALNAALQNPDDLFFTPGLYQIQVGSGTAQNHATYKDYYLFDNRSNNSTWPIGLTLDASVESTYVYIWGSHDNWHMEFNHGTDNSYYVGTDSKVAASAGNLSFIPNADKTEWKIWGGNTNRWIGWNLNGPAIGVSSQSNDANNNCYFIFTKVEEEDIPTAGKVYTIKAHFTSDSYTDIYLTSNTGAEQLLLPMPTTATANQSYWVAEASGNTDRPWKFKSGYGYAKYLDWQNGGLSANGDNFGVLACSSVAGTYHLNVSTSDRNIGTWGNNNDTKKGFGAVGSGGCWSQNKGHYNGLASDNYWTTDYEIVSVKGVTAYKVSCDNANGGVAPAFANYGGVATVKNGGYIIVPDGTTLNATNFPAAEISGYTGSVTFNGTTITVTYEATVTHDGFHIYESNGTYSNTASSSEYKDKWLSTDTDPQFTILETGGGRATNNMYHSDTYEDSGILCYTGNNSIGYTSTMTVSVQSGYKITGYTFKVKNLEGTTADHGKVVTTAGQTINTTAANQTVEVSGLNADNFTITLDGSTGSYNEGLVFTDFYVTYEEVELPTSYTYDVTINANGANVSSLTIDETVYAEGEATFNHEIQESDVTVTPVGGYSYTLNITQPNGTEHGTIVLTYTMVGVDVAVPGTYYVYLKNRDSQGHETYLYSDHGNFPGQTQEKASITSAEKLANDLVWRLVSDGTNVTITNGQGFGYLPGDGAAEVKTVPVSNFNWITEKVTGYAQVVNINILYSKGNDYGMNGTYQAWNGGFFLFASQQTSFMAGSGNDQDGEFQTVIPSNVAWWTITETDQTFRSPNLRYDANGDTDEVHLTYTYFYQYEADQTFILSGLIAEAFENMNKVGYYSSEDVEMNQEEMELWMSTWLYPDACMEPDGYYEMLDTFNEFCLSHEVITPQPGQAFRMSVRTVDCTKQVYLTDEGTLTDDPADAAIFVAGSSSDGEGYNKIFASNNNSKLLYLNNTGATEGDYTEGTCDFKLVPMNTISDENGWFGAYNDPAHRFGTFYLEANNYEEEYSDNYPKALMMKENGDDSYELITGVKGARMLTASDDPDGWIDAPYSTAVKLEEVEYPYTEPTLASGTGDGHTGVWASVWLPFPMNIPDGIEVYKGTQERTVDGDPYLGLTKVDPDTHSCYAAGGYLLYSTTVSAGPIDVLPANSVPTDARETDDAAFVGSTENPGVADDGTEWTAFSATFDGKTPYVLANKSNGVGFYKYVGTKMPKGKAIWLKPADSSDAECVKLGFDDIISAIEALHGNTTNAEIYDLQGHRLDKVEKGQINVINGQKIMFK